MSDDDFFLVARNRAIWACWLTGKPAVNLGSVQDVVAAMQLFLETEGANEGGELSRALGAHAATSLVAPPQLEITSQAEHSPTASARPVVERAASRHELTIIGRIFTAKGSRDVTILDLSETGCQFHDPSGQLEAGGRLTVKIGPVGPLEATARWRQAGKVGVEFASPLYPSVLQHIRDHFDLRR